MAHCACKTTHVDVIIPRTGVILNKQCQNFKKQSSGIEPESPTRFIEEGVLTYYTKTAQLSDILLQL